MASYLRFSLALISLFSLCATPTIAAATRSSPDNAHAHFPTRLLIMSSPFSMADDTGGAPHRGRRADREVLPSRWACGRLHSMHAPSAGIATQAGGSFARDGLGRVRRRSPPTEIRIEAVEIEVDDRRREQRQRLAEEQAADHGETKRPAQLRAGAGAEHERQAAEQRRRRRHHDRPEAQQAGLPDRLDRRHPLPFGGDGEIDHHDAVLLDDADEEDDADERDDAEI